MNRAGPLHTILGANGVIGRELSAALTVSESRIRLVSRNPVQVHPEAETVSADLLDAKATAEAVAGSSVAYLTAGLRYNASVWEKQWPKIMKNVIDACKMHRCRLAFFDNVYAYGKVEGVMTEQTPFNPVSRKGEVRARIATMLLDEIRSGALEAMIVRAADFYGPGADKGFPHHTVFSRLHDGKTPRWIGDPKTIHTFSYTPDAGRALAHLGLSNDAWGQTWHLPASREELTGEGFVRIACEVAGRRYGLRTAPDWMLAFMGLWMPVIRENREMMYQFEYDYRFDSSKIEQAFGLRATPYREGIAATLGSFE